MAHQRKLIRQDVVALLVRANTAAGARVKPTRVEPHRKTQLPAISVYTLHDSVDAESKTTAPVELTHTLQLEIVGWVAHSDTYLVDDAMDDLAEQIETAMDLDVYLNGTAGDSQLTDTLMEVVEDDGRSEPMIGIVTLTFAVTYRTAPAVNAPTMGDFVTVHTETKFVGTADNNAATDQFVVQVIP